MFCMLSVGMYQFSCVAQHELTFLGAWLFLEENVCKAKAAVFLELSIVKEAEASAHRTFS